MEDGPPADGAFGADFGGDAARLAVGEAGAALVEDGDAAPEVGAAAGGEAGDGGGAIGAAGTTTAGAAGAFGTAGGDTSHPASSGGNVSGAGGISLSGMTKPHLRHFIRTERPATFSSAI
jgi:hypothetical protein